MNGWHLAVAAGLCVALMACSRREGVFSLSPVFTAKSDLAASAMAHCVTQRWGQGTRRLHRGKSGSTITLRAESFFSGAAIGLRLEPEGRHTRVEYFERRFTDPLYWSMVRGCLDLPGQRGATGASASAPHS
ncbi:hypothetical protein NK8_66280 (plasmid) [Caballeronia sp. NK8]|uniref:hypothetical protein n=1 Tax=Caballeronia sp. NK8 TaxID=140098 RepID=UPI001BB5889D|nr:hypothetical protein [Caballeronia sp. NK8]BCQ28439.1 hypothetical protein NK8_66280 [Caballeronia sp. NK8]